MRRFNITGLCVANKHYMADTTEKIKQIVSMVEDGQYFTINKARQYGKTTTLTLLEKHLQYKYIVISISFEGVSDERFQSPSTFCQMFLRLIQKSLKTDFIEKNYADAWNDESILDFDLLSEHITRFCRDKIVILLIDEVDKTSNNRIFMNFLGMLRNKYLDRDREKDYTFHSVILAGVHDIKNIKIKLTVAGKHTQLIGEDIHNSPWNIAADFLVDMSFNSCEIMSMLNDYEVDHNTGMDTSVIANEIYKYTSGYPFLVSKMCKHIDERLGKDWTIHGIQEAVKILSKEHNTLYDDMFKNLENKKELYDLVYDILILGRRRSFSSGNPVINMGLMYGILKESNQYLAVSNMIFEIVIVTYLISKDESRKWNYKESGILTTDVVINNKFNMELALRKFAEHYKEIFSDNDIDFLERHGRLLFLTYLKPLINGKGFFHIESQFTDLRRMDIVVDFNNEQFIIELKIWKGNTKHHQAYDQLNGYLDSKNVDTGYLLTFDFRKSENKTLKAEWVEVGGKQIFDVII